MQENTFLASNVFYHLKSIRKNSLKTDFCFLLLFRLIFLYINERKRCIHAKSILEKKKKTDVYNNNNKVGEHILIFFLGGRKKRRRVDELKCLVSVVVKKKKKKLIWFIQMNEVHHRADTE